MIKKKLPAKRCCHRHMFAPRALLVKTSVCKRRLHTKVYGEQTFDNRYAGKRL